MTIAEEADKNYHRENIIGEQLVGAGFSEIMNNSLTKSSYYEETGLNAYPWEKTVKVMNPLSADLGVMRQTLLFGGLESIVRNVNRKAQNLRFFEVGNVYKFNKEKWSEESPVKAYSQDYHMALWVTGNSVFIPLTKEGYFLKISLNYLIQIGTKHFSYNHKVLPQSPQPFLKGVLWQSR